MDKWLTNNNVSKIIALVVSIILWAMVQLDTGKTISTTTAPNNTKIIDNIKVQVTGFDESKYVLYSIDPEIVRIEVKGKRSNITSVFSPNSYKVKLDLTNVGPGTSILPLYPEVPSDVETVSIEPATVSVTIEEKITKSFNVNIVTKGQAAAGVELGIPVIRSGEKVQVTLPRSEMDQVDKIQGIIDVTDIDDKIQGKTVKLIAYDKKGHEMTNAEISPSSVEVDVSVTKLFKNVPIEVKQTGQLPEGYALTKIETSIEGVALYGSKSALDQISAYPVTIDLSQFKGPSEMVYKVNLTTPPGLEKIEPKFVEVTVTTSSYLQRQFENVPITIVNKPEKYTAKVITPASSKVTLTVEGSVELVNALKLDDIVLEADVKGLKTGVHKIALSPVLPSYIKLANENELLEVEIEITESSGTSSPPGTSSEGEGTTIPPNPNTPSVTPPPNEGGSEEDKVVGGDVEEPPPVEQGNGS